MKPRRIYILFDTDREGDLPEVGFEAMTSFFRPEKRATTEKKMGKVFSIEPLDNRKNETMFLIGWEEIL